MPKTKPVSVTIPAIEQEPLKIEFIWNDYSVVVTRKGKGSYKMEIFAPKNDGTFSAVPVHTVPEITNLMKIRTILEELFEAKII